MSAISKENKYLDKWTQMVCNALSNNWVVSRLSARGWGEKKSGKRKEGKEEGKEAGGGVDFFFFSFFTAMYI